MTQAVAYRLTGTHLGAQGDGVAPNPGASKPVYVPGGVPGDTVRVEGDSVYINGEPIEETYLKESYESKHAEGLEYNEHKFNSDFPNESFPDGKVPEDMLFVMGDNRSNSEDSRMIGYIPIDRVVGRADLVFWPIGDFHFIKH